jgi:hypothetical protein
VPLHVSKLAPGTEEVMPPPGARRVSREELFEKLETPTVVSETEPTLIAVEMQAGAPRELV